MNKRVKWGIIIVIGAGLIGGGIYSQLPKENEELAAADKVMTGQRSGKKILNVNAKIIKPQLLKDEIQISGSLLPDEEVDLSFETSGKIIEINFEEGSFVKKGQLLAKVNDRPLQAQLQRLVSQLKLAEDRVFRQNALLERDAVSKEAYEQVKTELATLNADIDLIESNIAQTELRAPFDGVIGLRQVSVYLRFPYNHCSQTHQDFAVEGGICRTRAVMPNDVKNRRRTGLHSRRKAKYLPRHGLCTRIKDRPYYPYPDNPCTLSQCQRSCASGPLCQHQAEQG